MARRCCRDSVAMKVIAVDGLERDGAIVFCRWCDGYARYEGHGDKGRWIFADQDTPAKRAEILALDPAMQAREKAYTRMLGRERQR